MGELYIYRLSDDDGIKISGFEELNQPWAARTAELSPNDIFFFAERGTA